MLKKIFSCVMTAVLVAGLFYGTAVPSVADATASSAITAQEALKDLRVRQALTLAIDRKVIAEQVAQGGQTPATGYVPYGLKLSNGVEFRKVAGNFGINPNKADVTAAKKLLADAGYPGGKGFPTITILYNTGEAHKAIAESIQEMWLKNLGVHAEMANQEWADFQDTRHEGSFEIARGGWIGDYEDPMTFLDLFTTYSGNNDAHWKSAEYDQLIETARTTTGSQRDQAMLQAEKMLMDNQVVLPIYYFTLPVQTKSYVKNVYRTSMGQVFLDKTSAPKGLLRYNIGGDPKTLDPGMNEATDANFIITQNFEGLMRLDEKGLRPGVAKSYTKSADGKTYTFKIRDDAKWSDGKSVTADDFEYAWKRILNPKIAATNAFQMFYIEGAQAYNEGKGQLADVGIHAVDHKTLVVKLNAPTAYFLNLTTSNVYMPVRKDVVTKNPDGWAKNPKLAVSNGPFHLASYSAGDTIKLVPNKYWWRKAEVRLKTIKAVMITDESTSLTAYESGDIDINGSIPVAEIPYLKKSDKTFKILPYLGVYYYMFNFGDSK